MSKELIEKILAVPKLQGTIYYGDQYDGAYLCEIEELWALVGGRKPVTVEQAREFAKQQHPKWQPFYDTEHIFNLMADFANKVSQERVAAERRKIVNELKSLNRGFRRQGGVTDALDDYTDRLSGDRV